MAFRIAYLLLFAVFISQWLFNLSVERAILSMLMFLGIMLLEHHRLTKHD